MWTSRIMHFHIAAGGHTGRHSHPGPVFVMIKSGTMTLEQSDGSSAEYPPGTGFVEAPDRVHIARNEGDVELDTREDIERLAHVQNRAANEFQALIGVPFDQVPALTECGETALSLAIPSQAPVLPMSTIAAGIVLAAEVVKDLTGRGMPLHNYLVHDLRFRLRSDCQKYKPKNQHCQSGTHD